jgi:hypothetical protein
MQQKQLVSKSSTRSLLSSTIVDEIQHQVLEFAHGTTNMTQLKHVHAQRDLAT